MIIGIDFDNTIVCYDNVYKKIVSDANLVPPNIPANKAGVKKYLIEQGQESKWTELQGAIYGPLMKYAKPFPHVIQFIQEQLRHNHKILIISHRTEYPILGPQYDLHEAAREWIKNNLKHGSGNLIQDDFIFFNTTKENKITKIIQSDCDCFIDDLPEILDLIKSNSIKKILFSPDEKISTKYPTATSWEEVISLINDN